MTRPQPFELWAIGPNCIEVRVHHEVELCSEDVVALHAALLRLSQGHPYAVLVDRANHYSYSFEAMRTILHQPLAFAMAFVLGSVAQRPGVEALLVISAKTRSYPVEMFSEREKAIAWLTQQGARIQEPARKA